MVGGEVKVATVTSENIDTMATLPISVTRYAQHQGTVDKTAEKNQSAKDLEAQKSRPHFVYHQIKRLVEYFKSFWQRFVSRWELDYFLGEFYFNIEFTVRSHFLFGCSATLYKSKE